MGQDALLALGTGGPHHVVQAGHDLRRGGRADLLDEERADLVQDQRGDPGGQPVDQPVGDLGGHLGRELRRGRDADPAHPGVERGDLTAHRAQRRRYGVGRDGGRDRVQRGPQTDDLLADRRDVVQAGGQPGDVGGDGGHATGGVTDLGDPVGDLAEALLHRTQPVLQRRQPGRQGVQPLAQPTDGRLQVVRGHRRPGRGLVEPLEPGADTLDHAVPDPVEVGLRGQVGQQPQEAVQLGPQDLAVGPGRELGQLLPHVGERRQPVVQAGQVPLEGGDGRREGVDRRGQALDRAAEPGQVGGQPGHPGHELLGPLTAGPGRGGDVLGAPAEGVDPVVELVLDALGLGGAPRQVAGQPVQRLGGGRRAEPVTERLDPRAQVGQGPAGLALLDQLVLDGSGQQGLHPLGDRSGGGRTATGCHPGYGAGATRLARPAAPVVVHGAYLRLVVLAVVCAGRPRCLLVESPHRR